MISTSKRTSTNDVYDIGFIVSAIAMAGILLAMPYQISSVISLGTYAIAGCAVIMYIKYVIDHMNRMVFLGVILFFLIAICFLTVFVSHKDLKSDMVSAICFLEIPMFMLCGKEIKSKHSVKIFIWIQYILSFYYLYLSTTNKAHYFEGSYGTAYLNELTLSYHNPNEASMYLTACLLTLLVAIILYKNILLKILFGVNAGIVLGLVFLTRSRAGMLVCIAVCILLIFLKKIPVTRMVTRLAFAAPLVMVILIYFFNDKMVEWQIFGSSVETGRINVFNQVFNNLEFHEFFLGDFGNLAFNNLHNIYISVFGTIGIIGFILYVAYMYNMFIRHQEDNNYAQKLAYIGILLLVIYSSVESTFFTGGSAFAMCFMGLYLLAGFSESTPIAKT